MPDSSTHRSLFFLKIPGLPTSGRCSARSLCLLNSHAVPHLWRALRCQHLSSHTSSSPFEVNTIFIPILQMRKMRYRQVHKPAPNITVRGGTRFRSRKFCLSPALILSMWLLQLYSLWAQIDQKSFQSVSLAWFSLSRGGGMSVVFQSWYPMPYWIQKLFIHSFVHSFNSVECLPCAKHCAWGHGIVPVNPHNKPMKSMKWVLLSPFFRRTRFLELNMSLREQSCKVVVQDHKFRFKPLWSPCKQGSTQWSMLSTDPRAKGTMLPLVPEGLLCSQILSSWLHFLF